jgi:SNF2 family DNA or RNA helicase
VSSRLRAVATKMREIVQKWPRDKMLVFCSMSSVLARLQGILQRDMEGQWASGIYDGKATVRERQAMRQRMETDDSFKALLITYGAGAAGLNLQMATHILEIDPCFNDATLVQAEARACRVGQTRFVRIYRFRAPKTYEMRMDAIRARKAREWEEMRGVGEGDEDDADDGVRAEDIFDAPLE